MRTLRTLALATACLVGGVESSRAQGGDGDAHGSTNAAADGAASTEPRDAGDGLAAADFDAGVRAVDGAHVEVRRAFLRRYVALESRLARGVRVVPRPAAAGGGFHLFGIRAGTLPARLGLANGDVLRAIDDKVLESPQEFVLALTRAAQGSAPALVLSIERRGAPASIELQFR